MPKIQVIRRQKKTDGNIYETYSITIPIDVIKETGWGTGDDLKFRVYKNGIVVLSPIK